MLVVKNKLKRPNQLIKNNKIKINGGGNATAVEPSLGPTEQAEPKRSLVSI